MPLTKDRDTRERDGKTFNAPVAAGVTIFAGALVALNAAGDLVPGTASANLTAAGRAKTNVSNAGGLAGDVTAEYESGTFLYGNSAGADELTRADIGADCYIVDDETVAKTDDTGARSVAGVVADISENGGVWVTFA